MAYTERYAVFSYLSDGGVLSYVFDDYDSAMKFATDDLFPVRFEIRKVFERN